MEVGLRGENGGAAGARIGRVVGAAEVVLDVADPTENFGEARDVAMGVRFPEGTSKNFGRLGGGSDLAAFGRQGIVWPLVVVVLILVATALLAVVPFLAGSGES